VAPFYLFSPDDIKPEYTHGILTGLSDDVVVLALLEIHIYSLNKYFSA
jgi:uncharacterized membrane protein YkvA (DUF1232 family)